ncbi:MAG: hypothetical protein ACTSU5_04675, partial [Promethearchaeota archaeon]
MRGDRNESSSDDGGKGHIEKKITTGIFVFAIALVSIWTGVMVGTREPERYVGFGILNAEGT